MRKNIHRIAKPIAYITATTLIAALLFACGSKDEDVSKIKEDVEDDSVSEETKSLKDIFGMFFDDEDDTDDTDDGDSDDADVELETETSVVTEVDDNGEEVTRVVTYVQKEDGTKEIVTTPSTGNNKNTSSGNNTSTQKPSSNGNGGNSSSGSNTSSGSNGSNGNTTTTAKPGTASGGNSNGNTGSSNNAGTATTGSADNANLYAYHLCTGETKYAELGSYTHVTDIGSDGLGIYHLNVTPLYMDNVLTDEYDETRAIDAKMFSVPCADFWYFEWWVCNDCGVISKDNSVVKHKTATGEHNYVEQEARPATYMDYGEIDCICTKCGDTYFDRNMDKLKWRNDYYESYLGLNGLEVYEDESVYQYDSQLTKKLLGGSYITNGGYSQYEFIYIYKLDSGGNPIYEKTILGYDKNGNAIWNDRPYWINSEYEIYKTIADIEGNNPLYSWANRIADGTLIKYD